MKKLKSKKTLKTRQTKRTRCLGVDQSLNGMAAALVIEHEFRACRYITKVKSQSKMNKTDGTHLVFGTDDTSKIERLEIVTQLFESWLDELKPDYVALEDYAFAMARLPTAELGGALKLILYRRNIPFTLYDPKTVKLFATGNGAAEKDEVTKAVEKRFNISLAGAAGKNSKTKQRTFGKGSDGDIADAAVIADILCTELDLRAGTVKLVNLPESERRVFNRVTKTRPENILSTPFVQRTMQ